MGPPGRSDADPIAVPRRSWWLGATVAASPCLVLVLRGEELIGGLALERDRRLGAERLRLVGSGALCPDHLDALAAPGQERAVASALRGWLGTGDRLIDLDGVVTAPLAAVAMPGRFRMDHVASAPWMQLRRGAAEQGSSTLQRRTSRAERRMRRDAGSCCGLRVSTTSRRRCASCAVSMRQRWEGTSGFLSAYQRFAAACRAGAAGWGGGLQRSPGR